MVDDQEQATLDNLLDHGVPASRNAASSSTHWALIPLRFSRLSSQYIHTLFSCALCAFPFPCKNVHRYNFPWRLPVLKFRPILAPLLNKVPHAAGAPRVRHRRPSFQFYLFLLPRSPLPELMGRPPLVANTIFSPLALDQETFSNFAFIFLALVPKLLFFCNTYLLVRYATRAHVLCSFAILTSSARDIATTYHAWPSRGDSIASNFTEAHTSR